MNQTTKLFNNKLFSDLTLNLVNDSSSIVTKLYLHKNILWSKCSYFTKILTSCKEQNSNEITMYVKNPTIMTDIIASFYGIDINQSN